VAYVRYLNEGTLEGETVTVRWMKEVLSAVRSRLSSAKESGARDITTDVNP